MSNLTSLSIIADFISSTLPQGRADLDLSRLDAGDKVSVDANAPADASTTSSSAAPIVAELVVAAPIDEHKQPGSELDPIDVDDDGPADATVAAQSIFQTPVAQPLAAPVVPKSSLPMVREDRWDAMTNDHSACVDKS